MVIFLFRFLIFSFALVFSANAVQSQVLNVESFRSETDADTVKTWAGETGFDVSLSKFNDRVFKLGNETNAAFYSGRHRYLFLTSVELIDVDGSSVISNGYFHLRSTFNETKTFSPELFSQYQYNENLGMQERFLTGASVRYSFLEHPSIRGSFVTGGMFEHEKWGTEELSTVENNQFKSTSSLVVRGQIAPQAQLLLIGYYQARPDRFFKPRVISENQLSMQITTHLTFRVKFTLSYDVEPIIDIPKLTYELKNGLIIAF